jgi:hypothetical protein
MTTDLKPWERQPGETAAAFHAFCHYRDQPQHDRSLKAAFHQHLATCRQRTPRGRGQVAGTWRAWVTQHQWVERVDAYSAHLDEQRRRENEEEIRNMNRRHARQAEALQFVASLPIRLLIERVQSGDQKTIGDLKAAGAIKLLKLAATLGRIGPVAQQAERLARGLETEAIRVATQQAELPTLSDRIAAATDPTAVEDKMAELIELLTTGGRELPATDADLTTEDNTDD